MEKLNNGTTGLATEVDHDNTLTAETSRKHGQIISLEGIDVALAAKTELLNDVCAFLAVLEVLRKERIFLSHDR